MKYSRLLLTVGFVIMVVAHLYVPISMIYDAEHVLTKGKAYRFRIAPIDPNDPFRGKYIILNFRDNSCSVANTEDWQYGEKAYGVLEEKEGYTVVKSIHKERPELDNYCALNISYTDSGRVYFSYPFDQYYMEESKAPKAEAMYRTRVADTSKPIVAVVHIQNGRAVLADIRIGDSALREMVR